MPHKLQNMLAKVPSDIDIAQGVKPISIEKIAAEVGILHLGCNRLRRHPSTQDLADRLVTAGLFVGPQVRE